MELTLGELVSSPFALYNDSGRHSSAAKPKPQWLPHFQPSSCRAELRPHGVPREQFVCVCECVSTHAQSSTLYVWSELSVPHVMCMHNIWAHVCDGVHKHVHAHVRPALHVFASHFAHLTRNRCPMCLCISATVRAVSTYNHLAVPLLPSSQQPFVFFTLFCADTFLALVPRRTSVTGCIYVLANANEAPRVRVQSSLYTVGKKSW